METCTNLYICGRILSMRQSHLFTKTRKEVPHGEEAKNAQLLIRAGFIHKEMAGVYSYLPLGLRVMEHIKQVVREEMNAIGTQELLMSSLQSKELWESTDRWDDEKVDVWFKTRLHSGKDFHGGSELGIGWSHEEPIGNMMKNYISSYKDLPVSVYQFQNKLRNEVRAKSGVMRGREFVMKDAYSLCATEEQHEEIYAAMQDAYMKVFNRIGLGDDTFITFAPGGAFTQFSHEFQTVCDAGEDVSYISKEKNIAINEEILSDETLAEFGVSKDDLVRTNTAEVGNIFNFGRQKGEELGVKYKNADGGEMTVWMGSYGIGVTRLMGVLVEKFADENGMVWPEEVSPYKVHIIELQSENEEVKNQAEKLYTQLADAGISVLYDDRDARPGEKLADADLIGCTYRVVVSDKSLKQGGVELKKRTEPEGRVVSVDEMEEIIDA